MLQNPNEDEISIEILEREREKQRNIMPSIGQEKQSRHRVFLERRRGFNPSSSLSPLSSLNDVHLCQSFSYNRLPQQLLKLSVLKLDGSAFDIHVSRNATVAELKQGIEEVFSSSPKEGDGKISWSHVWGHFCLCFEGQKFINDKSCIRNYGIKDGDQLRFIRHMSIDYEPTRRLSRSKTAPFEQYSRLSSGSNNQEVRKQTSRNDNDDHNHQEDNFKYSRYEVEEEIPVPEFKLANFLKGWLSYSRLWSVTRSGTEGRRRPSRFSMPGLGGGTNQHYTALKM